MNSQSASNQENKLKFINRKDQILILFFLMLVIFTLFMVQTYALHGKYVLKEIEALNTIEQLENEYEEKLRTIDILDEEIIYSYIRKHHKRIPKELATLIAGNIVNICKEESIPMELVVGVIEVESDFNPTVVSKKNARGLMQVRYSVWGDECKFLENEHDLHDVELGIRAGICVLKNYLGKTSGDISEALYLYVGKDRTYVDKVNSEIGKFLLFKNKFK